MADKIYKSKENVPGRFYVDDSCIDCDLCRENAPAFFKRQDDAMHSYVYRQPVTEEEIAQALDAAEACPTESIGTDG